MTITASKFGFNDITNTVVALTDGDTSTYWAFDNPSGVSNNSWIQLDFGYPVKIESLRFWKNSGGIGDFKLIGSNNPATDGTDAVGADDVLLGKFKDLYTGTLADSNYTGGGSPQTGTGVSSGSPNISYFTVETFNEEFRYYRIIPITGTGLASGLQFQEIIPDYAVRASQLGFTNTTGTVTAAVDGDHSTSWVPAVSTFPSASTITSSLFTANPGTCPFIQFDFGEPVSLAAFFADCTGTGGSGTTLGDCHLVASNSDCTAQTATFTAGSDKDCGFITGASIEAGTAFVTGLTPAETYRYYRLVFGAGDGPNGGSINEFRFALDDIMRYTESDYDSIFSRGDRIANGLMSTGHTFPTVSGAAANAFDNDFSQVAANHFAITGSSLAAGLQWWWDFGGWALELNGVAFTSAFGSSETTSINFALYGGLTPTAEWPDSYANEFSTTGWSVTGTFDPTSLTTVEFTPKVANSWPTYAFVNLTTRSTFSGSWLADEMWFKVRHSTLDGGDRNGGRADKHVIITASSGIGYGTADSSHGDYTALLDGVYDYQNAGVTAATPTTSYSTLGGTGLRRALIDATTTANITNGPISNLVDGAKSSDNGHGLFCSTSQTGKQFKFAFPFSAYIDEFKWTQNVAASHGTFSFQGSNDDTTYVDLQTGINLGGAAAVDIHTISSPGFYKYYRLLSTAGSTSTTPWIQEIEFKLAMEADEATGTPVGATSYSNLDGSGARTSRVTCFLNAATNCGGTDVGSMAGLVDGDTSTQNCANSTAFQGGISTAVIKFLFREALCIDEFTWIQQSVHSHGTFTLDASIDGISFTTLATGITLGATSTTEAHAFTNTNGYHVYRLTQTSGTLSTLPWIFEVQFKTAQLNAPSGGGGGTPHDTKAAPCFIQAASGGGAISTANEYIQFQFPRPVTPNHIVFERANGNTTPESYTGSAPQHYGVWHWEASDDGTTFTALGDPWSFTEACQFMTAPRLPAAVQGTITNQGFELNTLSPDGHPYWRMVLDSGSAFGSTMPIAQVMFNLTDLGNQIQLFIANFSDDTADALSFSTAGFTSAAPEVIPFSDDSGDGFGTAIVTIHQNVSLVMNIDDGADFEAFSQDLTPVSVTQTVTVITGT